MLKARMKIGLKEGIEKEINYFEEWAKKSKKLKNKKRFYKHCIRLLKNKNNWSFENLF